MLLYNILYLEKKTMSLKCEAPGIKVPTHEQPELVLTAARTGLLPSLEPHQLSEHNGDVNCRLLEIHLFDSDNKEDIRRAESVSDLHNLSSP